MGVDRVQPESHRCHRDVGTACLAPPMDLRRELVDVRSTQGHVLAAEVVGRPARVGDLIPECVPHSDGLVDRATDEDESVGQSRRPFLCRLSGAADEPCGVQVVTGLKVLSWAFLGVGGATRTIFPTRQRDSPRSGQPCQWEAPGTSAI